MQTEVKAINRITGAEIYLQANEAGEGLVAQGDAEFGDATRTGKRFSFQTTNPVAAVVAIPTVATICSFTNTDPDGGRSVIIDAIYAIQVGNWAAVLGQCHMIFIIGQTQEAVLTFETAIFPRKLNGLGPSSDTCIRMTEGGTDDLNIVTGVAVGWTPIGESVTMEVAAGAKPGIGLWGEVNGRIILPPNRVLGLHVLASSATPTFNMGIMWHERQITLA